MIIKNNLISKEVLADICPQLKQFRLERGLSLEELQAAVHISVHLLKRMEDGKCFLSTLLNKKTPELFGVFSCFLFFGAIYND